MLQITVLLKNDHLVEENKKTKFVTVRCSSRKDQILNIKMVI